MKAVTFQFDEHTIVKLTKHVKKLKPKVSKQKFVESVILKEIDNKK